MIINNYTYKTCGKIYRIILEIHENKDNNIINIIEFKNIKSLNTLRTFLLCNPISIKYNVIVSIYIMNNNNLNNCFYVYGRDISKFLELE